jgi:peptidoglycan/LPS O-acetylase OafA/YrhL
LQPYFALLSLLRFFACFLCFFFFPPSPELDFPNPLYPYPSLPFLLLMKSPGRLPRTEPKAKAKALRNRNEANQKQVI